MNIGITGSSGLLGSALREHLERDGHGVRRFLRGNPDDGAATWNPATGWIRGGALEGLDAVVHLAGESIGNGRWTAARRQALRASRIETTRMLVGAMRGMSDPPALVSASGIGFYGDRGDEVLTEQSQGGSGFLADLTRDWEGEAFAARDAGARVAVMRFGVVLAREGGALPRMATPFKFGAGGRLGNGKQWFPWIALEDAVRAVLHLLEPGREGAYNVTSPEPVTNAALTKALASALHRPALFPVPPFALRAVLGDSANELLLAGQRAVPERLLSDGFVFHQPRLAPALAAILGRHGREAA